MGSQIHGQVLVGGDSTRWQPIAAVELGDGTYALKVDTELTLDSANINLSNVKVASVDQTSNTLRYIKVLDDGTIVTESSPLDGYEIADVDDENEPAGKNYYGYSNMDEDWYILEEDLTVSPATYRYFKGTGGYVAGFAARTGHAYDYFHNIF
jgi:hypothetical protein